MATLPSAHSRQQSPPPRLLPSGWWEGVPENLRKRFDRKILRLGYLLNLDGYARGLAFFRMVYRAEITEGGERFICHYRHDPEARNSQQGGIDCTCGLATVKSGCAHQ